MDQIQSTQNVSFQAHQANKLPPVEAKVVTQSEIKDGDNKSMQALKWAGIIGAGALLAVGACKMMKGKTPEIDAKWFDIDALKKGEAVLTKEGKEQASKLAKKCSGISKDGKIGDITIKQVDGDSTFAYIFKDGKRTQIDKAIVKDGKTKNISQIFNDKGKITKSIVDGKEVTLEYYGNGKLAKSTKDGVTTVYEYATFGEGDATKEKLVRKIIGDQTTEFRYNDQTGLITHKLTLDKKTSELKKDEFYYDIIDVNDEEKIVLSSLNTNYGVGQEFEYHSNGKLRSHVSDKYSGNDNVIRSLTTNFNESGEKVSFSDLNFDINKGHLVFDLSNGDTKSNIEISNFVEPQNGHRKIKFDLTNGDKKANFTIGDGKLTYTDETGKITEFKDIDELVKNQPELLKKINATLTEADKITLANAGIDSNSKNFGMILAKMFEL